MQDDKIIVQKEEQNHIDIIEQTDNSTITETIEIIEAEEPEIFNIDSQEAFPSIGEANEELNHSLLNGRDLPDQHPIQSITGLDNELTNIKALKRHIYASQNGLSEFRRWKDNNPKGSDRTGYFVKLVPGKNAVDEIDICQTTDDVYGVTVKESGFVGGQSNEDHSDEWQYAMVGVAGALRVRTDGTPREGDYVVPNLFGEATKSENKCGYKVISHGAYPSYPYVTIAMTPQNDKLSKIYKDLTSVGNNVGNITIQIEDINNKLNNTSDKININISDTEELKDLLNDTRDIADEAMEIAKESKPFTNKVKESLQNSINDSKTKIAEAQKTATDALTNVSSLTDEMTIFKSQWSDDNGTNLAAILQMIDDNGASIQNLVSHIDKYSVGEKSLSDGLTDMGARAVLTNEYIYVPTADHDENMIIVGDDKNESIKISFERGYAYQWNAGDSIKKIPPTWEKISSNSLSTSTEYQDGIRINDLWYCWQDVVVKDGDIVINTYPAGTLYRWSENKEWIAVAKNNTSSRTMSLIKQSTDKIQSIVTNLDGKTSLIEQNLESITTTVSGINGEISNIKQNAEEIAATVSDNQGKLASLQTSVNDNAVQLIAVTSGNFCNVYQSLIGTISPYEGENRYSSPPQWNETNKQFSFEGITPDDSGTYFFHSEDKTKYVKITGDNTYEIYTIGNIATSTLQSRITDAEAILHGVAAFATGDSEALSGIYNNADTSSAVTDFLTSYYRHQMLNVSKKPIEVIGDKYSEPPTWNIASNEYEFDSEYIDNENGQYYYMSKNGTDEDGNSIQVVDKIRYCKVVSTSDGTKLYEIYGTTVNSLAAISQKTDENGASIGMVVQDGEVQGSVLVNAINDRSTILINADKIGINGTAIFTDKGTGSTTISGDYVRTGIIQSNEYELKLSDYEISATKSLKIENREIVSAENNDVLWCCYINVEDLSLIIPSISNSEYYWNSEGVASGNIVKTMNEMNLSSGQIYVIANHYFDIIPTKGMKIDLDHSTITTPNFSIDNDGNAFFKGEIRAISGYIGNEKYGFEISRHKEMVCNMSLYEGESYYFILNGKYYSFIASTSDENSSSEPLRFNEESGMLTYKGEAIEYQVSESQPSLSNAISLENSGCYYIGYNQFSLEGDGKYSPGIYMAPDGVGLGNGKFWIDSSGDISIHGNLTLDGSVKWGSSSSPSQALYHSGSNYGLIPPTEKPNMTYDKYNDDDKGWHKIYSATDHYASYTYDGGNTWTVPIKIRGSDGSDAVLDEDEVFNMLTNGGADVGLFPFYTDSDKSKLYINATYINSGTLKGISIEGCKFFCTGNKETDTSGYSSAYYVSYGNYNGNPIKKGFLGYGGGGAKDGAGSRERVMLAAESKVALKIFTYFDSEGEGANNNQTGNISIGAGILMENDGSNYQYGGTGKVFFDSPVTFAGGFGDANDKDVVFSAGCKVDFTGATVTGLEGVSGDGGYAKFA